MKIEIVKFNKPTHETDGKFWINLQIDKVEAIKKAKRMLVIKLPQGYCKPVPNNPINKGKNKANRGKSIRKGKEKIKTN